ncbi:MAG: PIN domain-containing protein [bacterium]|nr:PIN domain-containing protein [bacterium]
MDRLFLDANVLFSAAYSASNRLTRLWSLKHTQLVTSGYASQEAIRNLPQAAQRRRLQQLLTKVEIVSEAPDFGLPRRISLPTEDTPVLQAALNAGSTHLLTGDKKHFGRYLGKEISGVQVVTPSQYLEGT